jgi:hypothetical protein
LGLAHALADEGQGLDGPWVGRLGLNKVPPGVHPAAEVPYVAVDGVVPAVGVGVDKSPVAGEE